MDRNKPVAQLSPLPAERDDSKRIRELEAAGRLVPPKRPPLSLEELRRLRVVVPGARVLEALLEEREDGR